MMKPFKKKPHDAHPAEPACDPSDSAPDAAPAAQPADAEKPPAQPAPAPAPPPAETELTALKEKHLRLMADFDNYRKRQNRDREDGTRRATESVMLELLPVLDHLELAIANAPDRNDPLAAGVRMVADQFLGALAKFDLKPFQSVGEPFDPARHEAVSQLPSADVPVHRVLHQLRRGYLLGGRLLRPSQVILSAGAPAAAPDTPTENATSAEPDSTGS
jgi:molecular chaperone GrpE